LTAKANFLQVDQMLSFMCMVYDRIVCICKFKVIVMLLHSLTTISQRDCSPYSLSYLSPPPDSNWRRFVHHGLDCSSYSVHVLRKSLS